MTFAIAELIGCDVSSRKTAVALRREIEAASDIHVVDFSDVRSVSWSFADELFGVLVRDKGQRWLSDNIRIRNAAPEVKYVILEAIDARISA